MNKLNPFYQDLLILILGKEEEKIIVSCEKAINEKWFEKARSQLLSKEEKSLQISYDPRQMDCTSSN